MKSLKIKIAMALAIFSSMSAFAQKPETNPDYEMPKKQVEEKKRILEAI